MPRTVNDARFTMWATVVPRLETPNGGGIDNHSGSERGSYQIQSDPDSGQPITVWVPELTANITPETPAARYDIRCYARGYTNLGFRSSANRETFFHNEYDQIESVQFDYPRFWLGKPVLLSHQSFVTNIRTTQVDHEDSYIWTDAATGKSIVWEVQGTTPVTDPFGRPLRWTTVLRRSQIQ